MKVKVSLLIALLLVLAVSSLWNIPSAEAAVSPGSENNTLNRSAFNYLIENLWRSDYDGFKASLLGEPYNIWTDDQGKILSLLALDPTGTYVNQSATTWGDALRNFIGARTMTNTGYVTRRIVITEPRVQFSDPFNFMVQNNLFSVRGDLSISRDLSLRVVYEPQAQTVAYIQGHVLYYNGTDKDLSYDDQLTSYAIESTLSSVTLRQIWDKTDYKLTIEYIMDAGKPYLRVHYKLEPKMLLTDAKVTVPLDQLDFLGTTASANYPHMGYQWFWAPGFADQQGNGAVTQHLLGDAPHGVGDWNQTWYMTHIRDKFDGTVGSYAIITDWGANKTELVAVDNSLTDSALPAERMPNAFHWLRQFVGLGDISGARDFSLNYYFLAASDWVNLSPVYSELMTKDLTNVDLSNAYQYGAVIYGLAKLYQARGITDDYSLAMRIHRYWYNTWQAESSGHWGSYMQSLPYILRGSIVLRQVGLVSDRVYLDAAIVKLTNELINSQNLNPAEANYGMYQEKRWWNSTSGIQYWGNSYLDFVGPAIQALSDKLDYGGANATIQDSITLAQSHLFLSDGGTSYGIVYWDPISQKEVLQYIVADRVVCYLNATNTVIDADIYSYKNALLVEALSNPKSLGWSNANFVLRELSYLWRNSQLNETVVYVDGARSETNTETQPWGVVGWRSWIDAMLTATGGYVGLTFILPSTANFRITTASWTNLANLKQLSFNVTTSLAFEVTALADPQPTGVWSSAPIWSWSYNASAQMLTASVDPITFPSEAQVDITWPSENWHITTVGCYDKITWNGIAGITYNFTGLHSVFPFTRVVVVNSTAAFDVRDSTSKYLKLYATPETNGAHSVWIWYCAVQGWIYSDAPMPVGIVSTQTCYGRFIVGSHVTISIEINTGVYNYGPRMGQLVNATSPYGNGTYVSYRYSLTVKPMPDKATIEEAFTWEPSGPGSGTLIIVGTTAVVIIGGVVYISRKRIKKWVGS